MGAKFSYSMQAESLQVNKMPITKKQTNKKLFFRKSDYTNLGCHSFLEIRNYLFFFSFHNGKCSSLLGQSELFVKGTNFYLWRESHCVTGNAMVFCYNEE